MSWINIRQIWRKVSTWWVRTVAWTANWTHCTLGIYGGEIFFPAQNFVLVNLLMHCLLQIIYWLPFWYFLLFLNLLVLLADFFYPEFLKTTWNYSFALLFLLLFSTLLFKIKAYDGRLAKLSFYLLLATGILIEIALIFKISTANFYTGLYYSLVMASASALMVFGKEIKRNKTLK